jgi:hypothetical protein
MSGWSDVESDSSSDNDCDRVSFVFDREVDSPPDMKRKPIAVPRQNIAKYSVAQLRAAIRRAIEESEKDIFQLKELNTELKRKYDYMHDRILPRYTDLIDHLEDEIKELRGAQKKHKK